MDSTRSRKLGIALLLIVFLTCIRTAESMRCYVCSWSAAHCQDFNCYNNPDVCTNNNFSPTIVRSVECPSGCESFVVTDPNGLVQQWRRNCDSSGDTFGQWKDPYQNCYTQYQLGLRITRCVCNDHLCNSSFLTKPSAVLFIMAAVVALCVIMSRLR